MRMQRRKCERFLVSVLFIVLVTVFLQCYPNRDMQAQGVVIRGVIPSNSTDDERLHCSSGGRSEVI